MNTDSNQPSSLPQEEAAEATGRRRLLRGGLAATPALLTLVSRPVMAATCQTASSHLSASLSRPNSGVFNCTGLRPNTWRQTDASVWPPSAQPGVTFGSVFTSPGGYADKTLLEMVTLSSDLGTEGLARHLVAAYLNAVKGLTPGTVLDVPTVKSIWASVVSA